MAPRTRSQKAAVVENVAAAEHTANQEIKQETPVAGPSRKRDRAEEADVNPTITKKVKLEPTADSNLDGSIAPSDTQDAAPVVEEDSKYFGPQKLNIYVFGSGEHGELGLGHEMRNGKLPTNVKRPRLNDLLDAHTVGVVQIAVGGMHCVALTHDNKIITWGVNDLGALGRDTSRDDEEGELNPKECTPTAIPAEFFGRKPRRFIQVAATDSASFALTAEGSVYGWGTFSGNDGVIGFFMKDAVRAKNRPTSQPRPAVIPNMGKIQSLATGGNHVLALDREGCVYAWGCGQQSQLGRRVMDRIRASGLTPCQFGLPKNKIVQVACGTYHSFAIDYEGNTYAWGLNNFGQTGIATGAGESGACITKPAIVQGLLLHGIKHIKGGQHHSVACTKDGELLMWGRCDESQAGVPFNEIAEEDIILDEHNKPRIISKPIIIPDIDTAFIAAGIDNSFALGVDGEAYSWGFSANYRTGLGTEDSIEEPTVLENSALIGQRLTFAACGGQFSVLAGPAPVSNDR